MMDNVALMIHKVIIADFLRNLLCVDGSLR